MHLDVIKKYAEKFDGGIKRLASETGMSEQNLHRCIRLNKIQAGDLEKIASLLGVDIQTFFDTPAGGSPVSFHHNQVNGEGAHGNINGDASADAAVLRERVRAMQKLLDEKERLIRVLMEKA